MPKYTVLTDTLIMHDGPNHVKGDVVDSDELDGIDVDRLVSIGALEPLDPFLPNDDDETDEDDAAEGAQPAAPEDVVEGTADAKTETGEAGENHGSTYEAPKAEGEAEQPNAEPATAEDQAKAPDAVAETDAGAGKEAEQEGVKKPASEEKPKEKPKAKPAGK